MLTLKMQRLQSSRSLTRPQHCTKNTKLTCLSLASSSTRQSGPPSDLRPPRVLRIRSPLYPKCLRIPGGSSSIDTNYHNWFSSSIAALSYHSQLLPSLLFFFSQSTQAHTFFLTVSLSLPFFSHSILRACSNTTLLGNTLTHTHNRMLRDMQYT